jgi:hypothetical protein
MAPVQIKIELRGAEFQDSDEVETMHKNVEVLQTIMDRDGFLALQAVGEWFGRNAPRSWNLKYCGLFSRYVSGCVAYDQFTHQWQGLRNECPRAVYDQLRPYLRALLDDSLWFV